MFLSLPGGFICTQSVELSRNLTSLNNLAGEEHRIEKNEGQASDDPSLNSSAI